MLVQHWSQEHRKRAKLGTGPFCANGQNSTHCPFAQTGKTLPDRCDELVESHLMLVNELRDDTGFGAQRVSPSI